MKKINTNMIVLVLVIALVIGIVALSGFVKKPIGGNEIYPQQISNTIFDDSSNLINPQTGEVTNTAEYLIKTYNPLTESQIQTLRNSGVWRLQASDVPNIYFSLIEETKISQIKSLSFIQDVYLPQVRSK